MRQKIEAYCESDPFAELERWADPSYFKKWKAAINKFLLTCYDNPDLSKAERESLLMRCFRDIGQDVEYIKTEESDILLGIMGDIASLVDITDLTGRDLASWIEENRKW